MVYTAWGLSLACEAALALALWRARERGPWLAYLIYDLLRGLCLWQINVSSALYARVWIGTEVVSLVLQFVAVGHATRGTSRVLGLLIAAGALAWSTILTPEEWSTTRRAGLMLRQAGVYGCFGALLSSASVGRVHGWLLAYYAMRIFRAICEQIATTPERVGTVNTLALFASGAFFLAWLAALEYRKFKLNTP